MITYIPHPFAMTFPEMNPDDYARLRDDIKTKGLLEPIVLYESKILDGRHRYRACLETHITPRFVDFGGEDPMSFIISVNFARRHLTASQIAMITTAIALHEQSINAASPRINADALAKRAGISGSMIGRALKIRALGIPELVAAVEGDRVGAGRAAEIASMKPEMQVEIVKRILSSEGHPPRYVKGSGTKKGARFKKTTKTLIQPAGTQFTRTLLGRIELIANELKLHRPEEVEAVITKFNNEFGWDDPIQSKQISHCLLTMQLLARLYETMSERIAHTAKMLTCGE